MGATREQIAHGRIGTYHCWTQCARQSRLLGREPGSDLDVSHRRDMFEGLLRHLTETFAVDLGNYTVLESHYHLLARTRPDRAAEWSAEEVAWRWCRSNAMWDGAAWGRVVTDAQVRFIVSDPLRVACARWNLQALPWYMALLNQRFSYFANRQVERRGRFWASPYHARRLDDEASVLTAMAYVDLNQFRAGMCDSLEGTRHAALELRLREWRERQAEESRRAIEQAADVEGAARMMGEVAGLFECGWLASVQFEHLQLPLEFALERPEGAGPRCGVMTLREGEGEVVGAKRLVGLESAEAEGERRPRRRAQRGGGQVEGEKAATAESEATAAQADMEGTTESAEEPSGATGACADHSPVVEPGGGSTEVEGGSTEPADRTREAPALENDEPSGDVLEGGRQESAEAPESPQELFRRARRSGWRRGRMTFAMHEEFMKTARRRASDTPFLAEAWPEYLKFLEGVVRASKERLEWAVEQEARLKALGVVPEAWAKAIDEYAQRAGIVVAGPSSLIEAMDALDRCWFRGVNYCRDYFT